MERKIQASWSVEPVRCQFCLKSFTVPHQIYCVKCWESFCDQVEEEDANPLHYALVECCYCKGRGFIQIGSGDVNPTQAGCRRCLGHGTRFRKKSPLELLGECSE